MPAIKFTLVGSAADTVQGEQWIDLNAYSRYRSAFEKEEEVEKKKKEEEKRVRDEARAMEDAEARGWLWTRRKTPRTWGRSCMQPVNKPTQKSFSK